MTSAHVLTAEAEQLLRELQKGSNVGQPSQNAGSFAYSFHAKAFLSNARALCDGDGLSDFRIYGALYSLRHGIELLLKCIIRNDMIDDLLRLVMAPGATFSAICAEYGYGKKDKKEVAALEHALCAMRNVLEDGIQFPQCHQVNVNPASADRAVAYLQSKRDIPREFFAIAWSFTETGHDLVDLWKKAGPIVDSFAADARRRAIEIGFDPPLSRSELTPVIALLAALDDGGDGFRYPSSITGAWYVAPPVISLDALKQLVYLLENTCTVFESTRAECYSLATLAHPTPQYSGE